MQVYLHWRFMFKISAKFHVSHGNARNPIHLTAMSELYHVVGHDLYCIYQNDVRWPCSTKSSSGFLNVWLRLSDKLDIFVCLRKSSNNTCASVESILSLLNSLTNAEKYPSLKLRGNFERMLGVGLLKDLEKPEKEENFVLFLQWQDTTQKSLMACFLLCVSDRKKALKRLL